MAVWMLIKCSMVSTIWGFPKIMRVLDISAASYLAFSEPNGSVIFIPR